jgi:ribonucleoside-triphosphate reductase
MDLKNFPEAADYVRGSVERDDVYYTNSIHLRPDADVDLVSRVRTQSMFHSLIESGAMIHAFVGENLPSAEAILKLVQRTFEDTQAAQLTISPEFTVCRICNQMTIGMADNCSHCGADNINKVRRMDKASATCKCGAWNREQLEMMVSQRGGMPAVEAAVKTEAQPV